MARHALNEKSLFLNAIEIESAERRARYLDEACGENRVLRARVEALLREHGSPQHLLDAADAAARPGTANISEGPGDVIGPYTLREQLGEGGFGIVYVAEQETPVRRKVALKSIKPGMDTRDVIARFEAERQALALMDHPNVARVLDAAATAAGRPYFVMELVRGEPITEFCDGRRLSLRDRLALFVDVCAGVQHAHQKGIIHRDLKPSNILVATHGEKWVVKVIDFGVAKAVSQKLTEKTVQTVYGQLVGTPMYMSPEQAEPGGLDVDTRSDVYSLGVLLYELLTGITPFDEEKFKRAGFEELRRMIREEDPPRPSSRVGTLDTETLSAVAGHRHIEARKLGSSLRGDLDWIVMKALEKDRTRRYESVDALSGDVASFLNNEPVQARPASAAYRLQKFARRNKVTILTATLIFAALLLGTVVSGLEAYRATQAESLASERLAAVAAAEREKSEKLWDAYLSEASARRRTGLVGARYESLAALKNAARMLAEIEADAEHVIKLRNEWIACSAVPADLRIAKTVAHTPSAFSVSPDHLQYVVANAEGDLILHSLADDRELLRLPGHGKAYWATWFSPDSRYLAARASGNAPAAVSCRVWDLVERRPVLETNMAAGCFALDFSPDGRLLAFGREDASIYLLDLKSGTELTPLSPGPAPPFRLAFSPQGDRLAVHYSGGNRELHIRDAKSGERLATFSHPNLTDGYVDWNFDGTLVAVTCDDRVYVWNVQTGQLQSILQGHRWVGINVTFSPTDDLLLSRCWDGTSRLWDPWTGAELVRCRGGLMGFQFKRDGRQAAFWGVAGKGGIWDVAMSRTHRCIPLSVAKGKQRHSVAIHPGGRVLAAGTEDGVRLYDLQAGREIAVLPVGACCTTIFQGDDGSLITSGTAGVHRWPMAVETRHGVLQIDPPLRLANSPASWPPWTALSRNDKDAATLDGSQVIVRDLEKGTQRSAAAGVGADSLAISVDGRWLAVSSQKYSWIKLWDLETEQLIEPEHWPATGASVAFSPDGRWLVASTGEECCIWTTGQWRRVRCLPTGGGGAFSSVAFSHDGQMMAVVRSQENAQLIETATWSELATLEAFDPRNLNALAFSPDDTQLAAVTLNHCVQLWDLRQIRKELRALAPELDWKLTPYATATESPRPAALKVVGQEAAMQTFNRQLE